MEETRIILEAQSVIKQYHQYDTIVTAVNRACIKVREGEFVAVIGSSGSGKSTFLHLCAGLDRPNAGTIYIRGNDITAMNADELGRFRGNYMGMIFQNHNLIPQFTALENILIPTTMCNKPDFSYEEHLKRLVATLGLGDRLHHLPSELSGGQQQRVAIARALINMPQVVFADEPTGNLDRKNSQEIVELLKYSNRQYGQTLIVITHDESIALQADRVLAIEDGHIVRDEVIRK